MMQRVGLLTLPLHSNYGGIIQAAALYALLQELGCQPVLLRKAHNRVWWKRVAVEVLKRVTTAPTTVIVSGRVG